MASDIIQRSKASA